MWLQRRAMSMHHHQHESSITTQTLIFKSPPHLLQPAFVEFSDVASAMLVHQTLQGAVLQTSDRGGIRIQCVRGRWGFSKGQGGVGWGAKLSLAFRSSSGQQTPISTKPQPTTNNHSGMPSTCSVAARTQPVTPACCHHPPCSPQPPSPSPPTRPPRPPTPTLRPSRRRPPPLLPPPGRHASCLVRAAAAAMRRAVAVASPQWRQRLCCRRLCCPHCPRGRAPPRSSRRTWMLGTLQPHPELL